MSKQSVQERLGDLWAYLHEAVASGETPNLEETVRVPFEQLNTMNSAPSTSLTDSFLDAFPITTQAFSIPNLSLAQPQDNETPSQADLLQKQLIGQGGTGQIHLAYQRSLFRDVALKSMKPDIDVDNPHHMLLQEGIITGHLEHPNIIPVHALGNDPQGSPILVMKYVEGVAWSELLKDNKHPFWDKLNLWSDDEFIRHLEILIEICKPVQFAHSRGILHRDIKPANVMLGEFGQAYLLDWGIAKHIEQPGQASTDDDDFFQASSTPSEKYGFYGTPAYMAPEMLLDESLLDERTDVYLLGATLHQILTGRPPHRGRNLDAVLLSVMRPKAYPYDASLPQELVQICSKALHPKPEQRYPSVEAFREALIAYIKHRSSTQISDVALERLSALRILHTQQYNMSSAHRIGHRHQLFTECRFGLMHALRTWEGNKEAQKGLEECTELMFAYEIQQRNLKAATGLLKELTHTNEHHHQILAQLKQSLQQEKENQAQLKAFQEDRDFSISSKQRVFLMLGMAVLATIFALIRFYLGNATQLVQGYQRAIFIGGFTTLAVLLGLYILRKALLRNYANRRFAALLILCPSVVTLHRAAQAFRQTPLSTTFLLDMALLACIIATAALTLRLWLGWISFLFTLGLIWSFFHPQQTYHVMTICVAIGWLLCAYFWSREQQDKESPGSGVRGPEF